MKTMAISAKNKAKEGTDNTYTYSTNLAMSYQNQSWEKSTQ
jgi:hypothetical protein